MTARKTTKETSTPTIEEEYQKIIRERLRIARESVKMNKTDVGILSASTVANMEDVDVSSIKLGHLFALANRYGLGYKEFIQFVFDVGTIDILDPAQQYLKSLPDDLKPFATTMLRAVSDYSIQQRTKEK